MSTPCYKFPFYQWKEKKYYQFVQVTWKLILFHWAANNSIWDDCLVFTIKEVHTSPQKCSLNSLILFIKSHSFRKHLFTCVKILNLICTLQSFPHVLLFFRLGSKMGLFLRQNNFHLFYSSFLGQTHNWTPLSVCLLQWGYSQLNKCVVTKTYYRNVWSFAWALKYFSSFLPLHFSEIFLKTSFSPIAFSQKAPYGLGRIFVILSMSFVTSLCAQTSFSGVAPGQKA